MKNKRVQALLLLSTAMLLASCGGNTPASSSAATTSTAGTSQPAGTSAAGTSAETGDSVEPIFSGVKAQMSCQAGESLNLLEGVTAVDDVDGNITNKIQVSIMPERAIVNGVVQFSKDDEGFYDVTYTVKDAAGNEANAYSEITVTEALGEKTLVKEYSFARDLDGWTPEIFAKSKVEGTHGISHGKYVYDITKSDGVDWHIKHAYYNYPVQAGHEYEITAKFNSTVAGTVKFNGVAKDIVAGDNTLTAAMSSAFDGARNIELQFGLLQGPFKVAIESIKIDDIEKTIDEEATADLGFDQEEVVTKDWTFDKDAWHCELSADAGRGTIAKEEDHATVTMTSEPADAYTAKFLIQTKNKILSGKKYHYSVTYTASETVSGLEMGIGDWADDFKKLAEKYEITLEKGVPTKFEFDVVPEADWGNAMLCLKMGNTPKGVSITASEFSVTSEAVIDLTNEKNVEAWADDSVAGKNRVVKTEKNAVTTKVTGEPTDPYKVSTNILMPNATLIDGKTYRISYDVVANKAVDNVQMMMGKLGEWDPSDLFNTDETINLKADEVYHMNAIVTPGAKLDGLKFRMKYGKAADGTEITIRDFKFEGIEFVKADATSILPAGWGFNADQFTAYGNGVNAPTVVANADNAVFTATKAGDLWEAKAIIESRTKLEKGTKYHIALDVVASADVTNVEFGAGFMDDDFKAIGHHYDQTLKAGETKKVEFFTPTLDRDFADNWGIDIAFGKAAAGTTVTVSNLVVESLPNAANKETKEFNYLPEGFSAYAKEDAGAECDLYVENGELVYDLIKIGHDLDWANKLTLSDIVLEGGAKYIFEITCKASVTLNATLILNKQGDWDVRASQAIEIGTEYKTFVLETPVMTAPLPFELLFQDLHQNTADSAKITFQSVKLFSQAVAE